MWSDKERLALNQDPSNIGRLLLTERFPMLANPGPVLRRFLERFFPQFLTPVQPARTESSTWAVYYGFDQYLWQPGGDRKRGVGLFFTFGVGWSRTDYTSNFVPFLRERLSLGLDHDNVVEMFYNAAVIGGVRLYARF
jgi:porin